MTCLVFFYSKQDTKQPAQAAGRMYYHNFQEKRLPSTYTGISAISIRGREAFCSKNSGFSGPFPLRNIL
jgi:hypothetical protein